MNSLITTLRVIHISAGMLALGLAPVAMLTVKGGQAHRRWGKIYFWAMAVVAASAVILALWRPRFFRALRAVFCLYVACSGYRARSRKPPSRGQGPAAIDWAAAL